MLAAFAEAARAFSPSPGTGRGDQGVRAETYRQVAERNADFLLGELRCSKSCQVLNLTNLNSQRPG